MVSPQIAHIRRYGRNTRQRIESDEEGGGKVMAKNKNEKGLANAATTPAWC